MYWVGVGAVVEPLDPILQPRPTASLLDDCLHLPYALAQVIIILTIVAVGCNDQVVVQVRSSSASSSGSSSSSLYSTGAAEMEPLMERGEQRRLGAGGGAIDEGIGAFIRLIRGISLFNLQ